MLILVDECTASYNPSETCSYDIGDSGTANLALGVNKSLAMPQSNGLIKNMFLCLAVKSQPILCVSYSPFFNVQIPLAKIPGRRARNDKPVFKRQESMTMLTEVMSVTHSIGFLTAVSGGVTSSSSTIAAAATTSVNPSTRTGSGSNGYVLTPLFYH